MKLSSNSSCDFKCHLRTWMKFLFLSNWSNIPIRQCQCPPLHCAKSHIPFEHFAKENCAPQNKLKWLQFCKKHWSKDLWISPLLCLIEQGCCPPNRDVSDCVFCWSLTVCEPNIASDNPNIHMSCSSKDKKQLWLRVSCQWNNCSKPKHW